MTSLADVRRGDVFLVGVKCTDADLLLGLTVALYGPHRDKMADGQIAPGGQITGALVTTPDQIPVQLVTGLVPVSVGDILQNGVSGETLVCMWSHINLDGSVLWSSAASHAVVYPVAGWIVIGHVDL